MLRDRIGRGVLAGAIAAAATAGALLGFGRARGATFALFNDAAHILLGDRVRLVDAWQPTVTLVAMLVHVVSLVVWGVLFALLAASLRGWRVAAAAAAFAGAILAIDTLLLPAALRPGFETAMTVPELVLLYGVMAAALAWGVREARVASVA